MQRLADNDALMDSVRHHQLVTTFKCTQILPLADKANLPAARLVSALRQSLSRALSGAAGANSVPDALVA